MLRSLAVKKITTHVLRDLFRSLSAPRSCAFACHPPQMYRSCVRSKLLKPEECMQEAGGPPAWLLAMRTPASSSSRSRGTSKLVTPMWRQTPSACRSARCRAAAT